MLVERVKVQVLVLQGPCCGRGGTEVTANDVWWCAEKELVIEA